MKLRTLEATFRKRIDDTHFQLVDAIAAAGGSCGGDVMRR